MRPETSSGIAGVVRKIAGIWSTWRRKREAADELLGLDPLELERIACDLRLTDKELKRLAAGGPATAEQLHRRLAALGIAETAIDHVVMQDMQRCCSECAHKRECDEDLAQSEHTRVSQTAKWPRYCPNETTITALMGRTCH